MVSVSTYSSSTLSKHNPATWQSLLMAPSLKIRTAGKGRRDGGGGAVMVPATRAKERMVLAPSRMHESFPAPFPVDICSRILEQLNGELYGSYSQCSGESMAHVLRSTRLNCRLVCKQWKSSCDRLFFDKILGLPRLVQLPDLPAIQSTRSSAASSRRSRDTSSSSSSSSKAILEIGKSVLPAVNCAAFVDEIRAYLYGTTHGLFLAAEPRSFSDSCLLDDLEHCAPIHSADHDEDCKAILVLDLPDIQHIQILCQGKLIALQTGDNLSYTIYSHQIVEQIRSIMHRSPLEKSPLPRIDIQPDPSWLEAFTENQFQLRRGSACVEPEKWLYTPDNIVSQDSFSFGFSNGRLEVHAITKTRHRPIRVLSTSPKLKLLTDRRAKSSRLIFLQEDGTILALRSNDRSQHFL